MSDFFETPWTDVCSWGFPGKNTKAGCHFLLQWIEPASPALQTDSLPLSHLGSPTLVVTRNQSSLAVQALIVPVSRFLYAKDKKLSAKDPYIPKPSAKPPIQKLLAFPSPISIKEGRGRGWWRIGSEMVMWPLIHEEWGVEVSSSPQAKGRGLKETQCLIHPQR